MLCDNFDRLAEDFWTPAWFPRSDTELVPDAEVEVEGLDFGHLVSCCDFVGVHPYNC